jgi:hypothetical protein
MSHRAQDGVEEEFGQFAGTSRYIVDEDLQADVNAAIALGRLGVPVGLYTGLSTDFFGDMLREGLAAAGIDASMERPAVPPAARLAGAAASCCNAARSAREAGAAWRKRWIRCSTSESGKLSGMTERFHAALLSQTMLRSGGTCARVVGLTRRKMRLWPPRPAQRAARARFRSAQHAEAEQS